VRPLSGLGCTGQARKVAFVTCCVCDVVLGKVAPVVTSKCAHNVACACRRGQMLQSSDEKCSPQVDWAARGKREKLCLEKLCLGFATSRPREKSEIGGCKARAVGNVPNLAELGRYCLNPARNELILAEIGLYAARKCLN